VRRLLAVVPDTTRGRRDRAILLTLVLTGRRRSEVLNMKAGDITIENGTVFYSRLPQLELTRVSMGADPGCGPGDAQAEAVTAGVGSSA
jgi:integrase